MEAYYIAQANLAIKNRLSKKDDKLVIKKDEKKINNNYNKYYTFNYIYFGK